MAAPEELKLARRRQQTAILSTASDAHMLYEGELGQRLAGVVYSSQVGSGYFDLKAKLLGRGGQARIPLGEVEQIMATWRYGILRFYYGGGLCWVGRVNRIGHIDWSNPEGGQPLCDVTITCEGLFQSLNDTPASLPSELTGDDADVSATTLVQTIISQQLLIKNISTNLVNTGTGNGPVVVSSQDTPLSLIVNAVTTGSSAAVPVWFGIFDPSEGPWLQFFQRTYEDVLLNILDTGLETVWDGIGYYNSVQTTYTNRNGSSSTTSPITDLDAQRLNGGLLRSQTISVDRVVEAGALSAAATSLAVHGNPIAINGQYTIRAVGNQVDAMVAGLERGRFPAAYLRAGMIARLDGYRAGDAAAQDLFGQARVALIEKVEYNVEEATATLGFDQRAVRPRLHEDRPRILTLRRAIEPGMTHNGLLEWFTETVTHLTTGVQISHDDAIGEFMVPSPTTAHFEISATYLDNITSTQMIFFLGIAIDGEDWDYTDPAQSVLLSWPKGLSGAQDTRRVRLNRQLQGGEHSFQVYSYLTSGDINVVSQMVHVHY